MKNFDSKIFSIIKKGFSLNDWEAFPIEIKKNEFIILELVKILEKFNIEKIKDICDENKYLIKFLSVETQLELVNNDNFCYLSEELQIDIINKNNQNVKYASEEIQLKFATQNPVKLACLNPILQRRLIDSNEFFLEFASNEVQIECVRENDGLLCRCSNLIQCYFVKANPNYYSKCRYEVKRDMIKLSQLSLEEVSLETLEHYLSVNYDKLTFKELKEYCDKMMLTDRNDKTQIVDYINYLIVNTEKKKF